MNKIIATALLLSAGTALSNAASVIPDSLKNDNLMFYWDFSTDSNPVKSVSGTTWGDTFTHNDLGYGSFSNSSFDDNGNRIGTGMWSTSLSAANIAANSFTVSFDFANFQANNWTNLFSLYTDGTTEGTDHSLQIQKTSSDAFGIYAGTSDSTFGGTYGGADNVIAEVIGVSSWQTITITSDGTNLCVYVDGTVMRSFDFAADSTPLTGLQFGSAFGNNRVSLSGDIDNIAIWNTALSAEQVKTLIIPEPSAFGLLAGAGALALVAARRRRSRKA